MRNKLALISGIAFIVLGVVFAADALDWIDVSAQLVFPVVMIAIGFGVVLGARGQRHGQHRYQPTTDEPAPGPPPERAKDDGGDEPPPDK